MCWHRSSPSTFEQKAPSRRETAQGWGASVRLHTVSEAKPRALRSTMSWGGGGGQGVTFVPQYPISVASGRPQEYVAGVTGIGFAVLLSLLQKDSLRVHEVWPGGAGHCCEWRDAGASKKGLYWSSRLWRGRFFLDRTGDAYVHDGKSLIICLRKMCAFCRAGMLCAFVFIERVGQGGG